jgi:hypothetical protein
MTWAKLDDRYDDHPKIKRAWRLSGYAVGLHSQAITASCRHESDGLVDPEWLADKLAHLPRAAASRAVDTLVRLRLFDELPAGETLTLEDGRGFTVQIGPLDEDAHVVHDFLEYNESSAYLADRRRRDAERKASRRRRDSDGIPRGVQADSNGSPDASEAESEHPDPTRPDQGEPADAGSGERAPGDRPPRHTGKVDQLTPPRELPTEIAARLDPVLGILAGIHAERGGNIPTPRGVGLALVAFPRRDHVGVARELEHWALAGNGQHRPIRDWVRQYRAFLERSPDADPTTQFTSMLRRGRPPTEREQRNAERIERARRAGLIPPEDPAYDFEGSVADAA